MGISWNCGFRGFCHGLVVIFLFEGRWFVVLGDYLRSSVLLLQALIFLCNKFEKHINLTFNKLHALQVLIFVMNAALHFLWN